MAFFQSILLMVFAVVVVLDAAYGESNDAALKPQTPIAGTNLFLNTLYKMVDRTRKGCYATYESRSYKDISGTQKGVIMYCAKADQGDYSTADSDWIFERADGNEDSNDEYKGLVKIKNVGAKLYLVTMKSSDVWWVLLAPYKGVPATDKWNVRTAPNNKNNLQLEIQKWWITLRKTIGYHRYYVALKKNTPANYKFNFVDTVKLDARMYNFVFDQPLDGMVARHSKRKDLIDSYDINNNAPTTLTRTITVNEKKTNEFAWGFAQSLTFMSSVTAEAGIPFLTSGTVEVATTWHGSANQNWKSTNEKTFSMSYSVSVPPYSTVRVSAWYELIRDIKLKYTASAEITGHSARITIFDDVVKDARATGVMIRRRLEYAKFEGKVVEIKDYSVIVEIKGTMTATAGVNGQLNVDGHSVAKEGDQVKPDPDPVTEPEPAPPAPPAAP